MNTQKYRIGGTYNIQDIKYDLLKIIQPHDGYMVNKKQTNQVERLFKSYLGDLQDSYKIREYEISTTEKTNAVTFDINIKIHRDRAPKRLKIHVGRYVHFRDAQTEAA